MYIRNQILYISYFTFRFLEENKPSGRTNNILPEFGKVKQR